MSVKKLQEKIGANPDGDFGQKTLKKAMTFFKLTPERAAFFFGQVAHETGVFKRFSENLNYSEKRMLEIFKSDFDKNKDKVLSEAEKLKAKELAGKPEKIANFVYANQNGNGDEKSGDGWKFRGRGAIQLTGRANYQKFSDYLKKPEIMTNPDLVTEEYAFESALFFFERRKIWPICDKGVNDSTIISVTKLINGGTIGLKHRKEMIMKYYKLLTT